MMRSRALRVTVALVLAVGGVVAVSVLASSIGRSADPSNGPGISPPGEALDAVVMALLTLGLALTVAVFIVQFGGEREEREANTKKRFVGAVLVAVMAIGTIWIVREFVPELEFGGTAAVEEGEGLRSGGFGPPVTDDEDPPDRSTIGSWTGIAFGLLILAVGGVWMFSERRRRALDDGEGALDDDERDALAGLLDVAIEDLRADPDPRRAVIRTWGGLGDAFASVGLPREEAEAPFPYLERVLSHLDTSGPAANRLAAAFERAMFSPHAIDRSMQDEAVNALVAVRDELRVGAIG
jgi:hypothetical protein